MQRCDITLRLGGSLLHTVEKIGVSPAEIVILQSIHGGDAVVNIRKRKQDKAAHGGEYRRLAAMYGEAKLAAAFPGHAPKLPVSLEDAGIGVEPEPAEELGEEDEDGEGEPATGKKEAA